METPLYAVGNSAKDFIGQWKSQDEVAQERNPRLTVTFPSNVYEPDPGDYGKRAIIRTLMNIQHKIRDEELNKQEAEFKLNAANNLIDKHNRTFDELKAILDSLE